jgi:hypothetical protein
MRVAAEQVLLQAAVGQVLVLEHLVQWRPSTLWDVLVAPAYKQDV